MTELHCVQLRVVLLPSVYINTDQHDCGHPRKEEEEEAQKNNTNRRHYTHTHTPPSVYINTQQRRITGDTHKAVERLLTRTHTHRAVLRGVPVCYFGPLVCCSRPNLIS